MNKNQTALDLIHEAVFSGEAVLLATTFPKNLPARFITKEDLHSDAVDLLASGRYVGNPEVQAPIEEISSNLIAEIREAYEYSGIEDPQLHTFHVVEYDEEYTVQIIHRYIPLDSFI